MLRKAFSKRKKQPWHLITTYLHYTTAAPGWAYPALTCLQKIAAQLSVLNQIFSRYSAASIFPANFFFSLCGCILRGTTSFGMLVSIFEMFWNDVCIHLHSQVQIEPWICKCRADVCGSLRSARFIEEFVYTHTHTRTHTCTSLHTYICRFALTPFLSCMPREDYLFKTWFKKSFICLYCLIKSLFCECCFTVDVLACLFFHCLIKAWDGPSTHIKVL